MSNTGSCPKIFLLSPANASGKRAQMLLNEKATFDTALRLRAGTATLGEIFTFISGLYFRGKIAYTNRFGSADSDSGGTFVITPGEGLLSPDTPVTLDVFRRIASVEIDLSVSEYLQPLKAAAGELNERVSADCAIILLGSVATQKYAGPLAEIFGLRLLFPGEFAGRGDMSRGGLMLRSAREGSELSYVPVLEAPRRGQRPPKLPRLY